MKRKHFLTILAVIALLCLTMCACHAQDAAESDGSPMTLTAWTLTPKTWSSPNGATVCLSAQVNHWDDTVSAEFVVRMEDADIVSAPCAWTDGKLTAEAELNAADGYSYFVILTAADGNLTEVPLSTTQQPVDSSLVNLESALNSYCNVLVSGSEYNGGTLTLTEGSVEIQAPQITDNGDAITCAETVLILNHDGAELSKTTVSPAASEVPGGYHADLAGTTFSVPAMDDDGQLTLRLDVTLSNGQHLTCEGGSWTYIDGQIISTVG